MNKLKIIDIGDGNSVEIPISEFTKQSFLQVFLYERYTDLNLTSLIRVIQEKAKSKYSKTEIVRLVVADNEVEINIPFLAKAALFSYHPSEIETLFNDSMLMGDLENAVISTLPEDLQPSTSAQRTLAQRISEIMDVDIGYDVLASKQKISIFISQNQHELNSYDCEIEGYELVSDRIAEALVMYLEGLDCWGDHFNIAFELFLQMAPRGRELIQLTLKDSISDRYWNLANDLPEGEFLPHVLQELLFKHDKILSYSSQFEEFHKTVIYT